MKTSSIALSLAMFTALGVATALAAPSSSDKTFATKAAQGGLAEVELGQLAEQKATSPQVKQFAERMVTDHTQANQDLQQVAKKLDMHLPTQLDAKQKQEMERLRGMSGSAFDSAYMRYMVQDHKQDVSEFQKQAKNGSDAGLTGFAQKYLPTLQQHLQMAETTSKQS